MATVQLTDKKLLGTPDRSDTGSPKAADAKIDVSSMTASDDAVKSIVKSVLFGTESAPDAEFLDLFLRVFETLDKNLNDLLDYTEYASGIYVLLFRPTNYYKTVRALGPPLCWKSRDNYEEDLIKTIPPFKVDQLSFSPFCTTLIRWISELYRQQQLRSDDPGVERDLKAYVESIKKEITANALTIFGIKPKDPQFMATQHPGARKLVDQSLNEVGKGCAFFWSIFARIAFLPFVYATSTFEFMHDNGRNIILCCLAFLMVLSFLVVMCYLPIFTMGLWLVHRSDDDGFSSRISFLESLSPFIFYIAVSIVSIVGQIVFLDIQRDKTRMATRAIKSAQLKVSEQFIKLHYFGEYRYKHKKDMQILADTEKKQKDPKEAVFVWSDAGYQYSNYTPNFFFYRRHILIAMPFAFIHVIAPNVFRCIDAQDASVFAGSGWEEKTIVIVQMTVGFFWVLVLLCFLQVAVDDMKVLRQSMADLGALIDSAESKKRLNMFLDVRESQNLEYWMNLRSVVYDNVRESFTQGFAIPAGTAAVILDISLALILLWRVYIDKVYLDVFNCLLIWDLVMISLFILAFLWIVSKVNDAASGQVDKLNVVKFGVSQKVIQFLREQRVIEDKLARDDKSREKRDADFFEKEEKAYAQRVNDKDTEEKNKKEAAANAAKKSTGPLGFVRATDEEKRHNKADDSDALVIRANEGMSRRMSVAIDNLNRRGWMEYQTAQAANLMLEASIYAINGQRSPLQLLGFVVDRALVTRITSLLLAAAASGIVSFVTTWYSDHY